MLCTVCKAKGASEATQLNSCNKEITDLGRGVAGVKQERSSQVQAGRRRGGVEVSRHGELVAPQQTFGQEGAAGTDRVQPWPRRSPS